ncbi:hypothetical protein D3C80_1921980 [compost metagenome]
MSRICTMVPSIWVTPVMKARAPLPAGGGRTSRVEHWTMRSTLCTCNPWRERLSSVTIRQPSRLSVSPRSPIARARSTTIRDAPRRVATPRT